MKFVADNMLGRLARWLRLMGFDVIYQKNITDKELVKLGMNRIILTRDKELGKYDNVVVIESIDIEQQIRDVIKKLNLKIENEMSRCSVCNTVIERIEKVYVKDKVPENIYCSHDEFWICNGCNRIYWQGSHYRKIMEKICRYQFESQNNKKIE